MESIDIFSGINCRYDLHEVDVIGEGLLNEDSIKMAREAGVDVKEQSIVPVTDDGLPGMGTPIAIVGVVLLSVSIYLVQWRKSLSDEEVDQNYQS